MFIIQSNINHFVFILASKIDSSKMFHEYSARQKYYNMNLQFVICWYQWYLRNLNFHNSLKISLSNNNFVLCPSAKKFSRTLLSNFILFNAKNIFNRFPFEHICNKKYYVNYQTIKLFNRSIIYCRKFCLFPWNYQSLVQQILTINMIGIIFDS